jgi:hypothetical protein
MRGVAPLTGRCQDFLLSAEKVNTSALSAQDLLGHSQHSERRILAGHWWLTPVILATWKAETRRVSA